MSTTAPPLAPTRALFTALALASLLSCDSTGEADNRGAKRGAIGGALLGVTMGALTGDASMAARGAAVGAVAGGVAGSMTDLESDRDSERTRLMADAIADRPSGAVAAPEAGAPQTWSRLDDLPGEWTSAIWGIDAEGNRITATANWTGTLASTRAVRLELRDFDADAAHDALDGELTGYCQLSYDPEKGYELLNVFSGTADDQRWVGERTAGEERYSFYYVGSTTDGVLGTPRRDVRIELRFVGRDVFIIDTFAMGDSGEVRVQSYRFTRKS